MPAARDVCQVKIKFLILWRFRNAFFQCYDCWVEPKLQYRVDALTTFAFYFQQSINVASVQNDRLFAQGVSTRPQRKPNVRIMQVVW